MEDFVNVYHNIHELFKYNGIKTREPEKSYMEILDNIKIGSFEYVSVDSEDNFCKFILLPFENKYKKKKEGISLLGRYTNFQHLYIICMRQQQADKLKMFVDKDSNTEIRSYKPLMVVLPEHSHGNSVRVLDEKEEEELFSSQYMLVKDQFPSILFEDPLVLWHFSKIKRGNIIVILDISDNTSRIPLFKHVI